ncbi:MAG: hypothetical protein J7L61_00900 [Thermoplasmata archaeon]|nr:hypothetical protein [Thermoplasmata archaeon]
MTEGRNPETEKKIGRGVDRGIDRGMKSFLKNGKVMFVLVILSLGVLGASLAYNSGEMYASGIPSIIVSSNAMASTDVPSSLFVVVEKNGEGMGKVPVTVVAESLSPEGEAVEEVLYQGTTGEGGTAAVDFTPQYPGVTTIKVYSEGRTLEKKIYVKGTAGGSGGEETSEGAEGGLRMILSTDKPVYKPGQTIHTRILALTSNGVYNGSAVWNIRTPEGDILEEVSLSFNDMGVAWHDFELAAKPVLGDYTISVSTGDNIWEKTVVVDEYVLPKFEIELHDLREWYLVNESIHVVLTADYMFGKPVNGTANVTVKAYIPYAYYTGYGGGVGYAEGPYEREPMESPYDTSGWITTYSSTVRLYNGSATLSISPLSSYLISYSLYTPPIYEPSSPSPPPYDSEGYYDGGGGYGESQGQLGARYPVIISVEITDTAAHREEKSFTTTVATDPFIITVIQDTNVPGYDSTYYYIVEDPTGEPVANAVVSMSLTEDEVSAFTDDRGVAEVTFTYSGEYSAPVEVSGDGETSSFTLPLGPMEGNVKVSSDRPFYRVGDQARFTVYPPPMVPVFYEIRSGGSIVAHGEFKGDTAYVTILPEFAPVGEMRVYVLSPEFMTDSVVFSVEANGGLLVDMETDKTVCSPGDRVEITITARDGEGGVPCVIGLSGVDASVLELGERYMGVEGILYPDGSGQMAAISGVLAYVSDDVTRGESLVSYGSTGGEMVSRDAITPYEVASNIPTQEEKELVEDRAVSSLWGLMLLAVLAFAFAFPVVLLYRNSSRRGRASSRAGGGAWLVVLIVLLVVVPAVAGSVAFLIFIESQHTCTSQSLSIEGGNAGGTWWNESGAAMGQSVPIGGALIYPDRDADGIGEEGGEQKVSLAYGAASGVENIRLRKWFPETWIWMPYLELGEDGSTVVNVTVPDTITRWELRAIASDAVGRVGFSEANMTSFKDFFIEPDLPYSLTANDTLDIRVGVYNYGKERIAQISVEEPSNGSGGGSWFQLLSPEIQQKQLSPGEVASVTFTIRVLKSGRHLLNLTATAVEKDNSSSRAADRLSREVLVRPCGVENTTSWSDKLPENGTVSVSISPSPDSVPGEGLVEVKIHPTLGSVVVDGAGEFIHHVTGCGEQSLSGLSVDVAAYRNLEDGLSGGGKGSQEAADTAENTVEKMEKYERMVKDGIQHELQYLVSDPSGNGRGIVVYPTPNARPNLWLTAWGVITFNDAVDAGFYMDQRILDDMRHFIASRQNDNGSWSFYSSHGFAPEKTTACTAYTVRALLMAGEPPDSEPIVRALQYLESRDPGEYEDNYTAAITLLALNLAGDNGGLKTLLEEKLNSNVIMENGTARWESKNSLTSYCWRGSREKTVETTAYAVMALHTGGRYPSLVSAGVDYLLNNMGRGGFYSTQDTVTAFQALAMVGSSGGLNTTVSVILSGTWGSRTIMEERIWDGNSHLTFFRQLTISDLEGMTGAEPGTWGSPLWPLNISISSRGRGQVIYQVLFTEYVKTSVSSPDLNFTVTVPGDTANLTVGDIIPVEVAVLYKSEGEGYNDTPDNETSDDRVNMDNMVNMILIFLDTPTGFSPVTSDFSLLLEDHTISFYEVTSTGINVYIHPLYKGEERRFTYHLKAETPVNTLMEGCRAYDMYDTGTATFSPPIPLVVAEQS